jgi:hypothetical protein
MNLKLRYAIDKARAVSMPKENIERAVKKGCGEIDGVVFDEVITKVTGPVVRLYLSRLLPIIATVLAAKFGKSLIAQVATWVAPGVLPTCLNGKALSLFLPLPPMKTR